MNEYLDKMDKDAEEIRKQYTSEEAMRARYFDPRRVDLLAIFDALDDAGKSAALEALKNLLKP